MILGAKQEPCWLQNRSEINFLLRNCEKPSSTGNPTIFSIKWLSLGLQNQWKIHEKSIKNWSQDEKASQHRFFTLFRRFLGPKTLQDRTRIRPGPLKTPQDAPKNAQNRLEIGPRDSPEPSRRHLGSVQEASCRPEAPKNCPERLQTSILKDSGKIFGRFWIAFSCCSRQILAIVICNNLLMLLYYCIIIILY